MTKTFAIVFVFINLIFLSVSAPAQQQTPTPAPEKPPLTEKDLEKYTYRFDVADGRFTGDGATFIENEIGQNQFILLGEYHGSLRLSEFTRALVPLFDAAGCKNVAFEVGPISSQMLTEFTKDAKKTTDNLKAFNSKYYVDTGTRKFTPIPFFSNVEDAWFLTEASKRKWNIIGLDQEFAFGYVPLIDNMYANLSAKKKTELKLLYEQAVTFINTSYQEDFKSQKDHYIALSESADVNKFLDLASEKNEKNIAIAGAIRMTTGIYKNNASTIRKYYAANSDRVEYMKKNLREAFAKNHFDPQKDKMLLKMGSVHTGRGFSPLSLFEIGNQLSELASYNGNRSLHIYFAERFGVDKGKEVDSLSDQNSFDFRFRGLLQMGKKDQWTIIDLRPLREDVFYRRKFAVDEVLLDIFRRHDLLIIPKQDAEPTPNFVTR